MNHSNQQLILTAVESSFKKYLLGAEVDMRDGEKVRLQGKINCTLVFKKLFYKERLSMLLDSNVYEILTPPPPNWVEGTAVSF